MMRGKMTFLFLLLACFLTPFLLNSGFCQQAAGEDPRSAQEKQAAAPQTQAEEEKIIPSPKNIKEGTAIYVFVVWMWLSIFVLVYILRLKIKEVDRLYKIKFFSTKKN
jgi:hypothetical protein